MSSDFCPTSSTNFFIFQKGQNRSNFYENRQISESFQNPQTPHRRSGSLNGKPAKPSASVKPGDTVEILYASGTLKFRVLDVKEVVKKEDAASLYEVIPQ